MLRICRMALVCWAGVWTLLSAGANFEIEIRASWGEGQEYAVDKYPLYVGVPFPKGMLVDGTKVAVIDAKGNPVPSSSWTMALWPETNSVRWLGVDFTGDPNAVYRVVPASDSYTQQVQQQPALRVAKTGEDYWVDTGTARYHIPARGPLLGEVSILLPGTSNEWKLLIRNQEGDDAYVVDQNGREGIIGRDQESGQLVMELGSSPVRTVFRREGWYVSQDGQHMARHITRLHFYAGEADCRIEHTLVLSEDTEKLWLSDYGLRFRYAQPGDPVEVFFPENDQRGAKPVEFTLSKQDQGLFLLQQKAFWLSRMDPEKDCHFEIGRVDSRGNAQVVKEGKLAGDWMFVRTRGKGIGVTLRKLWEHFPKELSVSHDALQVHLWSSRGGWDMDMRGSTWLERWPKEWLNDGYHSKPALDALVRNKLNGVGVARTHDILLSPMAVDQVTNQFVERSELFSEQPIFYVDPWWLRQTEAMGKYHPYDPERFPDEEGFMEAWFDQHSEIHKQWGNYGFFDYGSGPHVWYRKVNDGPLAGQWIAYLERYSRKDYGFHAHAWRMFLRSGKRKYFDAAEKYTRQRLEVAMNHIDYGAKIKGTYQVHSNGPTFWGTSSGYHNDSGTDLRSFAYLYYATDNRLAKETLYDFGNALKRIWNSGNLGPIRGTRPFAQLKNIATVYQETGDPVLKEVMDAQVDFLVDLNAPQGVSWERELTRLAKYGVKSGAMHRTYEVSGNETAARSLLKGATTYATTSIGGSPFSYFNAIAGEQLSTAWYLTHDPLFARTMFRDMKLAVSHYKKKDGSGWEPMFERILSVAGNVYPLAGMAFSMDAIVDYHNRNGKYPDLPPYARQAGMGRKVLMAVQKKQGEPVVLDIRSRTVIDPIIYSVEGKKIDAVEKVPYTEQMYSLEPSATRFMVTIPAQLPAGVYLIDSGSEGEMWEVTWTNAEKLVIVAPGGVVAGTGGQSWGNRIMPASRDRLAWIYFNPPAGSDSFKLFTSGPVELRAPDGTIRNLEVTDSSIHEIKIPAEGAEGLWALRATGAVFVEWIGGNGILAYDDPERYFVPEISDEVLHSFGLSFPSNGMEPQVSEDTQYGHGAQAIGGARGVVMTGNRRLALPLQVDGVDLIDREKGTLEFWVRPLISSVYQFGQRSGGIRTVLHSGPWQILMHRYGEMSLTTITQADKDSQIIGGLEYNAGVVLENDRWTHVAVQWNANWGKSFWQIYIDGKPQHVLADFDSEGGDDSPTTQRFLAAAPDSLLYIGGSRTGRSVLNGVLAGLRFSGSPRYREAFVPDPKQTMRVDEDTRGLFLFNRSLEGVGPKGKPVTAKFEGR